MKILHIFPHCLTMLAALLLTTVPGAGDDTVSNSASQKYTSRRPDKEDRLFSSDAVEDEIARVQGLLTDPKLAWMFGNCFPNTLDTTVDFDESPDGHPDTFVYTGDIHAMWLRDSGAQVWPYVRYADKDEHLRRMLEGVIRRQFHCICQDPYANAFNKEPIGSRWESDFTEMTPWIHERKWEVDSHCYPIRLAYEYWKKTGDTSVFDEGWIEAISLTLKTFREQQRKDGPGPYHFQRKDAKPYNTKAEKGLGNPVSPCGLIVSSFRPSDDATFFDFLVPSNFFAVSSLRKAAEILETVNGDRERAAECRSLADEVEKALRKYAVVKHPEYGKVYAYEVDGFGNCYFMDDANVPSLLAMPYLGDISSRDRTWRRTRKMLLSGDNPYFFKGTCAEGIGGPHVGQDMIWPMSIMMRAFTSDNDDEIRDCLRMLRDTDAGTGFIHESFNKDDPSVFTREWFAWQNTLFGELVIYLIDRGKLELLNSL